MKKINKNTIVFIVWLAVFNTGACSIFTPSVYEVRAYNSTPAGTTPDFSRVTIDGSTSLTIGYLAPGVYSSYTVVKPDANGVITMTYYWEVQAVNYPITCQLVEGTDLTASGKYTFNLDFTKCSGVKDP
ncbi:MAG: hypothetical protein OEV66_12685 [Spirochaetia bacterium]|nr:hypothetical protein [Spirochaetia bacterium]